MISARFTYDGGHSSHRYTPLSADAMPRASVQTRGGTEPRGADGAPSAPVLTNRAAPRGATEGVDWSELARRFCTARRDGAALAAEGSDMGSDMGSDQSGGMEYGSEYAETCNAHLSPHL